MKISDEMWEDSQRNEMGFWNKELLQHNLDQRHRNTYYMSKMEGVCSLIKDFVEGTDLSDKVIMDLGSGPEGFCHVLNAKTKYAIDPLMHEFRAAGYDVEANCVEAMTAKAEEIAGFFSDIDVIFCLNSIDHHQDPELVVKCCYDVLKPAGDIIILTDTRFPHQCDVLHKIPLTQEALLRWMIDAGFQIVQVEEFPHGAGNPIMQFIIHGKK